MAADPSDVDDDAFLYGDSNGGDGGDGVEVDQADHPEPLHAAQQTEEAAAAAVESDKMPEQQAVSRRPQLCSTYIDHSKIPFEMAWQSKKLILSKQALLLSYSYSPCLSFNTINSS